MNMFFMAKLDFLKYIFQYFNQGRVLWNSIIAFTPLYISITKAVSLIPNLLLLEIS